MKTVVRTEETIGNNRKRSKKHNETHLFPFIPPDLIVEILLKFPPRSIAKFIFVSKLWSSIIHGNGFTKMYQLARSRTRPRLLFVVYTKEMPMQFLQSCSQEDPSSDHHRVNITPHRTNFYTDYFGFSPPIHGLICRQIDTKVMIGNPSTGQFVTLPDVKSRRRVLFSFFGYDPVNDVYKVLCMTAQGQQTPTLEHQVFTLGAKQDWRRIECKHPHRPPTFTKEICINGVVYYYAWITRGRYWLSERSLISFDLTSEEFNVITIREDVKDLVNYNGKIALTRQRRDALELWVLKDARKQKWSRVSLLVPSWNDLVDEHLNFRFRGTLSTGELIFSPRFPTKPFYFISFDLNKNSAKKVVVEGIGDNLPMVEVYFDHVESPMVLPFIDDF